MKQTIETDFKNMEFQLNFLGIGMGIAIFLLGALLFFPNKNSKEKSIKKNIGLFCLAVGIIATCSSIIQVIFSLF